MRRIDAQKRRRGARSGLGGWAASLALLAVLAWSQGADAKVTGPCSNCHTMHNSQNGSSVAVGGAGTGWNGDSSLVGTAQASPEQNLLVSGCVGCHSSTTTETKIDLGDTVIPIVYNTVEPTTPLAGGNFYWVRHGDSVNGHNVLTIPGMPADANLSAAPGSPMPPGAGYCANCHDKISTCKSCHTPKHHADDDATTLVGASGGYYRFLNSSYHGATTTGVRGIEDDDWQYTVSSSDHNEYYGTNNPYGNDDNSVSNYCAGCHENFHGISHTDTSPSEPVADNVSPWMLHPTHLALADTASGAEYHLYNTSDGSNPGLYNPDVPVARDQDRMAGMSGPDSQVYVTAGLADGDQVMCLSCHRAHGSPNADMLRWPYSDMNAGNAGAAAGTGCFVCHTTKD